MTGMPKLKAGNRRSRRPPVIAMTAQPTAERIRRASGGFEVGDGAKTLRMIDAQLPRALAREIITQGQYSAGQKFYRHWHESGLDPIKAFDPSRVFCGSGNGGTITEHQTFHRQRYAEARKELGPSADLIESVICDGMGYEAAERRRFGDIIGFGTRAQAITAAQRELQIGLERLRTLWGL